MRTFRQYLFEEDARIDPKTFNLRDIFLAFNGVYFGGELPANIPVKFGTCPKGAAGVTNAVMTRKAGTPRWMGRINPDSISITIQSRPFRQDKLYGILIHEMIHAWLMYNNINESHGPRFMAKLHDLQRKVSFTIPVKDSIEDEERGQEKSCGFLCGEDRNGRMFIALFTQKALGDSNAIRRAQTIIEYMISPYHKAKWAAFGFCTTSLVELMTVQRAVPERPGQIKFYIYDLKYLTGLHPIGAVGDVPERFRV
jgi:hypothetical protein